MHRSYRTGCCVAAVGVVVSAALGSETLWLNPAGGVWSDPLNWSAGVPGPSDTAVLPQLDEDGYAVVVDGTRACVSLVVSGAAITVTGGVIQLTGSLHVGSSPDAATLHLAGSVVLSPSFAIGASGTLGTLSLTNESVLIGGAMTVGDEQAGLGEGTIAFADSSRSYLSAVQLTAHSTFAVEGGSFVGPSIQANSVSRGGSLVATLTPGSGPPIADQVLILASVPLTGAFTSVSEPTIEGHLLSVVQFFGSVVREGFDPIVAVDITLDHTPAYIGFKDEVFVTATQSSGYSPLYPYAPLSSSDYSVGHLFEHTLLPLGPTPFVLTTEVGGIPGSLVVAAVEAPPSDFDRIDVSASGELADSSAGTWSAAGDAMTADGRFVVFASFADNLTGTPPLYESSEIFMKDRWTNAVEQLSQVNVTGTHNAMAPSISGDGRFVAFLRAPVDYQTHNVWLIDRATNSTKAISVSPSGAFANSPCAAAAVSQDGSCVVYSTSASNILPGLPAGVKQVLRYDIASGVTTVVSATAEGVPANGDTVAPAVSADGRCIAMTTHATNLLPGITGDAIVLFDAALGTWERIDVGPSGAANGTSDRPSISANGRFVAFDSTADNLGAPPDSQHSYVFVRDRLAGTTAWMSPSGPDEPETLGYVAADVSDGGDFVAFLGGNYLAMPMRVYGHGAGESASASLVITPWQTIAEGRPMRPQVSADASAVLFACEAGVVMPTGYPGSVGLYLRHRTPLVPSDLNHDGRVDAADLALLLALWNTSDPAADLDGDGSVGAADLDILLGAWTG